MKKLLAILTMTIVNSLTFPTSIVLAERAKNYLGSDIIYPDNCAISIGGEGYNCHHIIIGVFPNSSGNIKLCDQQYCFVLIIDANQFENLANGEVSYVGEIAWQKNRKLQRFPANLSCTSRQGLICFGYLNNTPIAIYTK